MADLGVSEDLATAGTDTAEGSREVVKRADAALYQDKGGGPNSLLKKAISALFQPAIPVQARNRSTTNQSLGSD